MSRPAVAWPCCRLPRAGAGRLAAGACSGSCASQAAATSECRRTPWPVALPGPTGPGPGRRSAASGQLNSVVSLTSRNVPGACRYWATYWRWALAAPPGWPVGAPATGRRPCWRTPVPGSGAECSPPAPAPSRRGAHAPTAAHVAQRHPAKMRLRPARRLPKVRRNAHARKLPLNPKKSAGLPADAFRVLGKDKPDCPAGPFHIEAV